MDTPNRGSQRGAIRVSDVERDQAVAELSEHYQAGRLTLEEFDDRSSLALRAQTGNDLSALFVDLPQGAALGARAPAGLGDPVVPVDLGGRRASRSHPARIVIACVIAAIILGNVTGNVAGGVGHHNLGWLVPFVILGFVFLRLSRHR
jgi:hypothetical protein